MHADPAGVLTGSHFLDGDHCVLRRRSRRRRALLVRLSHHAFHRSRRALRSARSHGRRRLHSDGRRAGCLDHAARRGVGRSQSFHGNLRARIFADDGAHRLRRHDRDALRLRRRAARRTIYRLADAPRAAGHDAGALGIAWRLRHHRALSQLAAGVLRPDDHRIQLTPRSIAARSSSCWTKSSAT